MAVRVQEKSEGSDVWWVFVAHEGQRISRKIGEKAQAQKVAGKIRESLKERQDKTEGPPPPPLKGEIDRLLVQLGIKKKSSRRSRKRSEKKAGNSDDNIPEKLREALSPSFIIERWIGGGAMGDVFSASRKNLGGRWAIKVLASGLTTDQDLVDRFVREARIEASLDHPNIVKVFDIGHSGEFHYLVMNYIEGEDLAERIARQDGPFPESEIVDIGIQVGRALRCAQEKQVTHRDIKPSNVRIRPDGSVAVLDFGIARVRDAAIKSKTARGVRLGTPLYMSPEQVRGDKIDPRSDLYSLGVLLYEMAAGSNPFEAEASHAVYSKHLHDLPKPVGEVRPDISPKLSEVITRLIQKDPDKRIQTARELISKLERLRSPSRIQPRTSPSHDAAGYGEWDAKVPPTLPVHAAEDLKRNEDLDSPQLEEAQDPLTARPDGSEETPPDNNLQPARWKSLARIAAVLLLPAALAGIYYTAPFRNAQPVASVIPAVIIVDASPYATITIRGDNGLGAVEDQYTPARLSLEPGEYQIGFYYQGRERSRTVDLRPGETVVIREVFLAEDTVQDLLEAHLGW